MTMGDRDAAVDCTVGQRLLRPHHKAGQSNHHDGGDNILEHTSETGAHVPRAVAARLYVSHFLSTWNSRLFEFGAALFLTSVFPGTLLSVSIYSLVRNAGYIIFAQPLGAWINTSNRLNIVRASIIGQRVPVAASCALFLVLERKGGNWEPRHKNGIFAVIVFLAVVEKLCSTMNTIAVERDWIVVITEGNEAARRSMNARMRRIDLFCKLIGPLTISLVAIASPEIAMWTTLGMNIASVLVEYIFIEQVYRRVGGLEQAVESNTPGQNEDSDQHRPMSLGGIASRVLPVTSLSLYFAHPAFLASFALSLLYFTVLSFSGQMITYLISVGYTSLHVGIARVGSSIFEISATWAAPFLMKKIGIVRAGIWSLGWQMACLAGALGWYFSSHGGMGTNSIFSASGLAVGVALSRIGLWGFDLCAQNIIQDVSHGPNATAPPATDQLDCV